jgi:hypothetical protein
MQRGEISMASRSFAAGLLAATAIILCSCSQSGHQNGGSEDAQESGTSSPNISPSAAPGVAFDYNYEFNLPDERISATQEAHASACENLGIARCRITGMSYSVDQNEQVTAELDLKLEPSIARQFGKSAEAQVEKSDGKLIRLDIGSTDQGAAISQAAKQNNDLSAQIARLEQELTKTKPGTDARTNLVSQLEQLQEQASQQARAIEAGQAALASTPMSFKYYGRGGVPGFRGNPVHAAWLTFVTTVVWLVGILLQALAVLIPLGVLIAALIALWRTRPMRVVRRWIAGPQEIET